MRGQLTGSLVGACFGAAYVLVNAGAFPAPVAVSVRVLGLAAFAVVLAVLAGGFRRTAPEPAGRSPFGAAYWIVVAIEAVALLGGLRVINGPMEAPELAVPWVSLVVGSHFFALAVVFAEPLFNVLGVLVGLCGGIGLVLAVAGAPEAAVAGVSGVVPGVVLLAAAWRGARAA